MKTRREQLAEQAALRRVIAATMGDERREWYGSWWPKPGSICADGAIVGPYQRGDRVPLIASGVVYLQKRRLAAAERFGWRRVGNIVYGRDLVIVER